MDQPSGVDQPDNTADSVSRRTIVEVSQLLENFAQNDPIFDNELLYPTPKPSEIAKFDPVTGKLSQATIESIVTYLTSPEIIDYQFIVDFFLSFRTFIDTLPLMELLLCRLTWCLKGSLSEDPETATIGKLALVRTFVTIRHWILNHFQDDFLNDRQMRELFTSTINELPHHECYIKNGGQSSSLGSKVLVSLKKSYLVMCHIFWNTVSLDKLKDVDILTYPIKSYSSIPHTRLSVLGLRQIRDPSVRRSGILSMVEQNSSSSVNMLLKERSEQNTNSNNTLESIIQGSSHTNWRKATSLGAAMGTRVSHSSANRYDSIFAKDRFILHPKASLASLGPKNLKNVSRDGTIENLYSNVLEHVQTTPVQGVKSLASTSGDGIPTSQESRGFTVGGRLEVFSDSTVIKIAPSTPLKRLNSRVNVIASKRKRLSEAKPHRLLSLKRQIDTAGKIDVLSKRVLTDYETIHENKNKITQARLKKKASIPNMAQEESYFQESPTKGKGSSHGTASIESSALLANFNSKFGPNDSNIDNSSISDAIDVDNSAVEQQVDESASASENPDDKLSFKSPSVTINWSNSLDISHSTRDIVDMSLHPTGTERIVDSEVAASIEEKQIEEQDNQEQQNVPEDANEQATISTDRTNYYDTKTSPILSNRSSKTDASENLLQLDDAMLSANNDKNTNSMNSTVSLIKEKMNTNMSTVEEDKTCVKIPKKTQEVVHHEDVAGINEDHSIEEIVQKASKNEHDDDKMHGRNGEEEISDHDEDAESGSKSACNIKRQENNQQESPNSFRKTSSGLRTTDSLDGTLPLGCSSMISTPPTSIKEGKQRIKSDEIDLETDLDKQISVRVISRNSVVSSRSYMTYDSSLSSDGYVEDRCQFSSAKLRKKNAFTDLRKGLVHEVVTEDDTHNSPVPHEDIAVQGNVLMEVYFRDHPRTALIQLIRIIFVNKWRFPFYIGDLTDANVNKTRIAVDKTETSISSSLSQSTVSSGQCSSDLSSSEGPQSCLLPYPGISQSAIDELAAIPDNEIDCDPIEYARSKLKGEMSTEKKGVPELNDKKDLTPPMEPTHEEDINGSGESLNTMEEQKLEDRVHDLFISSSPNAVEKGEEGGEKLFNHQRTPTSVSAGSSTRLKYSSVSLKHQPRSTSSFDIESLKLTPKKLLYGTPLMSVQEAMYKGNHIPFILSYGSDVLFNQMTLIERDLLLSIDWKEILDTKWDKPIDPYSSWLRLLLDSVNKSGLEIITLRFNLVTNWIISEILLCKDLAVRVLTISRFIHLGIVCKKKQNYATMFQVTLALTAPIIKKLKSTWNAVDAGDLLVLKELKDATSPANNFKDIRDQMDVAVPSKGIIPFIALDLSDLTVNSERSDTIAVATDTDGEEAGEPYELINFDKFRTKCGILKRILRLIDWSKLYKLTENKEALSKCLYLSSMSEQEMEYCYAHLDTP
ncbi:hypothetical protein HII12_001739 [Brettanomyces bruxellensis]|uniref:Guanine nucleotide exchange factor LTE1 n=1 Tax=Dekkera bruxellensis TaxID=5007 RepID=A0A8H6BKD5_DEKBR|nr:hypothetical protein HII12_001739 [Brettanomyces bruxellensis]